MHNFTPSGVTNFPADFQNEDIIVINPATWQSWSLPWSETDVPVAIYNSLSSADQEFYQQGDMLYTVGGYSMPDTITFQSVGAAVPQRRHQARSARRTDRCRLHLRRDLFDSFANEPEPGDRGGSDRRLESGLRGDGHADQTQGGLSSLRSRRVRLESLTYTW